MVVAPEEANSLSPEEIRTAPLVACSEEPPVILTAPPAAAEVPGRLEELPPVIDTSPPMPPK